MNKLLQKAILSIGATTMMVGGTLVFNTDLANGVMQKLGVKTESLQQNNAKLEEQKDTLLDKVVSLDASIKTLEGEKAELQRQLDEALANGSEEVASLQARIQELTTEIATLEGEKATLETEIRELETEVDSLEQEKTRLEGEVNKANTYLSDLETQIDAIQVNEVEALPNLDQYGTTEGVTPPTNNDNVWDIQNNNTFTYDGITFTRSDKGGVKFTTTNTNENVANVTIKFTNNLGGEQTQTQTQELNLNGDTSIELPPHQYHEIVITYLDYTSQKITFAPHDFSQVNN